MADTYFKNLKLIEAIGTPTDSTYYYKVPKEKTPYTVRVFKTDPNSRYVSERGVINGIPVSIDNSSYKGIPQYTDSLFNGYSIQHPEGKFYKQKVDKVTKEFQDGGAVSKDKKISWPYNSYYTEGDNTIPVKVNMFETTPQDTIVGITSFTNPINRENSQNTVPYHYVKLSGDNSKVLGLKKVIDQPDSLEPVYETGNDYQYYINATRQAVKNKNPEKWYNKVEDFMRLIAYPEVDKLKLNKYQQGGTLDANQLGQITKAAVQIANQFKKQGVITEIAGEQVIAQAFQNTPGADQIFTDAIKKQDMETVIKLFTKLGIVK